MSNETSDPHESLGVLVKECYLASRNLIESTLRQYDIGPTQWSILRELVTVGPMTQRDLGKALKLERATLGSLVTTLVRKSLVAQVPDAIDQRRRVLSITDAGTNLWHELPDPLALAEAVAFGNADAAERATAAHLLRTAVDRVNDHMAK